MALISMIPSQTGEGTDPYSSWFGTGEDGDVTISIDTPIEVTLDTGLIIQQYNSLTITSSGILRPANRCRGMLLLVKEDFTLDGTISVDKLSPLLGEGEDLALATPQIALCNCLGGDGGKAGVGGTYLYDESFRAFSGAPGEPGLGHGLGGGYGSGSASDSRPGGSCNPRPPVGTAIPYPCPANSVAFAGSGASTSGSSGGNGPGGSGGLYVYYSSASYANGNNGDAIGGGAVWIFVGGNVNIGSTGKISACGGNGGNGVTRTKSGSGGAVGSKTGLSGGGGAGGGGIIAIVYAGTIVNGGTLIASGGVGGAKPDNTSYKNQATPGADGAIGTVLVSSIQDLLTAQEVYHG